MYMSSHRERNRWHFSTSATQLIKIVNCSNQCAKIVASNIVSVSHAMKIVTEVDKSSDHFAFKVILLKGKGKETQVEHMAYVLFLLLAIYESYIYKGHGMSIFYDFKRAAITVWK